ncbi:DUF3302 domain-containing protein [Spirabiliibacterium falconis]|uniref:DUF3302 domain-containing protein n=1 Tax=Spirabiliibacterium falconis TaxID=572023 RepID=UPI001AACB7AA|nr:DUF3302 domain-containing protein [Spirabiliibacterium falconis]MBE2894068.1 DUF3302 domain-containing protein [Spirabiliibacterium falconis]
MFLDYLALFFLIFAVVMIFYGVIAIHDIPYNIAKKRNHPHAEAIHYAGWVSLFTLHIIWPFLWIWAVMWTKEESWGNYSDKYYLKKNHIQCEENSRKIAIDKSKIAELEQKVEQLSAQIKQFEQTHSVQPKGQI